MTLIKSISGIRGTIGGKTAENLTPIDAVKFAAAFGAFIKQRNKGKKKITIVIGRDARISGNMISSLVANTLVGLGYRCHRFRLVYDTNSRSRSSNGESRWRDHYHSIS